MTPTKLSRFGVFACVCIAALTNPIRAAERVLVAEGTITQIYSTLFPDAQPGDSYKVVVRYDTEGWLLPSVEAAIHTHWYQLGATPVSYEITINGITKVFDAPIPVMQDVNREDHLSATPNYIGKGASVYQDGFGIFTYLPKTGKTWEDAGTQY